MMTTIAAVQGEHGKQKGCIVYSDAAWTVLDKPPWFSKGLGGIAWIDDLIVASAIETPDFLVEALSPWRHQIS